MKKFSLLLLSLALVLGLASCSKFINTKTALEVYNETSFVISADGGMKLLDDDAIFKISNTGEISYLKDFVFAKAQSSDNLNEYGIFRVEAGKENDMYDILNKYVSDLQDTYRTFEYFPEETEKIDNARVQIFGSYLVYSFLNENDTSALHSAVKACLTK